MIVKSSDAYNMFRNTVDYIKDESELLSPNDTVADQTESPRIYLCLENFFSQPYTRWKQLVKSQNRPQQSTFVFPWAPFIVSNIKLRRRPNRNSEERISRRRMCSRKDQRKSSKIKPSSGVRNSRGQRRGQVEDMQKNNWERGGEEVALPSEGSGEWSRDG